MANITNEIISMRDRDTKHFATDEPNTFIAQISKNQHYYNPALGIWDDIENMVVNQDGVYVTQTNNFTFNYDATTGSYYVNSLAHGYSITFTPASLYLYDYTASNPIVKIVDFGTPVDGSVSIENGEVTRSGLIGDSSFVVTLKEDRLEKIITVNQRPTLPDLSTLGFNPDTTCAVIAIKLDSPFLLEIASTGEALTGMAVTDLVINDGQGQQLTIPSATCWGSNLKYKLHDIAYINDTIMGFGICVPYSFIQIAKYPIYIDPTVIVNTSTSSWEGIDGTVSLSNATATIGETIGGDNKSPTDDESRYYQRLNLTSIPAGSTCTSATYKFCYVGNGDANIHNYPTSGFLPTWQITAYLATSDWGTSTPLWTPTATAGTPQNQTQLAANGCSLGTTTPGYALLPLPASSLSAFFGGYACVYVASIPQGTGYPNYAGFFTANSSSNTPQLSITYTTGSGGGGSTNTNQLLLTGVGA